MLVELAAVEQRYKAVREVLDDGARVSDVALRYGVARQTVHDWLRRYVEGGMGGLADRSSRPARCPHQMPVVIEAHVVELRRAHPGWGPRTIRTQLVREGCNPVPGRSSIYRALIRHRLIEPNPRRRKRDDYKRWERSRSMELWQTDVMGRVKIADGTEASVVTGIDDHSRYCVIAKVVKRATARPVCEALAEAFKTHGVPDAVLSDNGKVFTGRFGLSKSPVLFDRLCHDNGVRHLLTAPYSPTTTGKIERLHKTMRSEFFNGRVFDSVEHAQLELDQWVRHYNYERPHQGIGDVAPIERFELAQPVRIEVTLPGDDEPGDVEPMGVGVFTRQVTQHGTISIAKFRYNVGRWLAGETVFISPHDGLIDISHRGVIVATHVQQHPVDHHVRRMGNRRPRPATIGEPVLRRADNNGTVSFAGTNYHAGKKHARKTIEVALVGDIVQLAVNGQVVRAHQAHHDRTKEHGAFATPRGRPRKNTVA